MVRDSKRSIASRDESAAPVNLLDSPSTQSLHRGAYAADRGHRASKPDGRQLSVGHRCSWGFAAAICLFFLASCQTLKDWTSCERFPGRCPDNPMKRPMGVRTAGASGPVSWRVTDVRSGGDSRSSWSTFVLVLTETTGSSIVFTRMEKTVWGAGAMSAQESGSWRLPANGELRLPMGVRRGCGSVTCRNEVPGYWDVTLAGKDDADNDLRVLIQITLPVQ